MSIVHHGRSPLATLALAAGGIAAFIAVAEAAWVVSVLAGPGGVIAGAALICAVFAGCWYYFRVRPMLRLARPARKCEPVPAESLEPASSLS